MTNCCCFDHSFTCTDREPDPAPPPSFHDVTAAVGAPAARVRNKSDDVRLVQRLLNKITFTAGGPETALKEDGICGNLTIAAIRRFQNVELKTKYPDGIVDPAGRTIYVLNEKTAPAGESNDDLRALFRGHIDGAGTMIQAGLSVVRLALAQASLPNPLFVDARGAALLNSHFKLDKVRDKRRHLVIIEQVLRDMHAVTAHQPKGPNQKPGFGFLEVQANASGGSIHFAFAYTDGVRKLGRLSDKGMRLDYIYLTRRLLTKPAAAISYAITHELAHFAGNVITGRPIRDPAYLHRNRTVYEGLGPEVALQNADSYSQFCHAARFGTTFAP